MGRRPDGIVLGAERLDARQLGTSAVDRLYETADGWLCLVVDTDGQVTGLGKLVGLDLLGDPRFATRAGRHAHDDELSALISEALRPLPTTRALEALEAADVPVAVPVPRNDAGFLTDPENHHSRRAAQCPHPRRGHVREVGVLVRVNESTPPPHRLAPEIGQHTDEILEMLGYDAEQTAQLRRRGVVR